MRPHICKYIIIIIIKPLALIYSAINEIYFGSVLIIMYYVEFSTKITVFRNAKYRKVKLILTFCGIFDNMKVDFKSQYKRHVFNFKGNL